MIQLQYSTKTPLQTSAGQSAINHFGSEEDMDFGTFKKKMKKETSYPIIWQDIKNVNAFLQSMTSDDMYNHSSGQGKNVDSFCIT